MLHFGSSHSIVTLCSRVSRAPPHHTLSVFINLNGRSRNPEIGMYPESGSECEIPEKSREPKNPEAPGSGKTLDNPSKEFQKSKIPEVQIFFQITK